MNDIADQTAGNWLTGSAWVIVVLIGAFVLIGVILWARRRNKDVTPDQHRRSETATHDLYQDPLDHDSTRR